MELFIAWVGFVGAWLLFAGPIYQAALELQEQDIEMDRIKASGAKVQKPKGVSAWWWLLPPVKIILENRQSREYRHRYIKALTPEDVESLIAFMSKATGWLLVACGGLFIAMKETYELAELEHWNHELFWAIIIVLLLISFLHVILRIKRAKRILKKVND